MTGEDTPERGIDNERSADSGFALDRRTAMKTGAVGLAALTGFASSAAADHKPNHGGGGGSGGDSGANQFRFAGQTWDHMYASTADNEGQNASEIKTLLEIDNVKCSNSWQDSLSFMPSIESSLITDISLDGDHDRSQSAAGVLGWIEIRGDATGGDWQMVTVDDDLVDPPQQSEIDEEGNLVGTCERKFNLARGVVGYNTRDFRAEWDLTEITEAIEDLADAVEYYDEDDVYEFDSDWDELFLDMYIQTRSANSFNITKTNIPGTHDIRLQSALHVFVDDDSNYDDVQAQAIVGNRQMFVEPRKIRADQD